MIKFTVSNTSVYTDGTRSDSNDVREFEDKTSFSNWLSTSSPYTLSEATVEYMLNGLVVKFTNSDNVVSHTTVFTIENTGLSFWTKLVNKLRGKKNG